MTFFSFVSFRRTILSQNQAQTVGVWKLNLFYCLPLPTLQTPGHWATMPSSIVHSLHSLLLVWELSPIVYNRSGWLVFLSCYRK